MKRFLCLIFTFLTVLSLTVPIGAEMPDYNALPPLDMDNTTIEYDFENVFFNDYEIYDFKYNSLKTDVELITMAEKGYSSSQNLAYASTTNLSKQYTEIEFISYNNFKIKPTSYNLSSAKYAMFSISVKPNTSYTVKAKIITIGEFSSSCSVKCFDNNKYISGSSRDFTTNDYSYDVIINSGSSTILKVGFYLGNFISDENNNIEMLVEEFSITEGINNSIYEPYGSVGLKFGLYFYIYNPSRLKIVKDSAYNLIQFGSNVTGGIKKDPRYKQHELKLINTYGATDEEGETTDALILKYSLSDYDNFIFDESFDTRFYDVSGIELLLEGESTSKEYGVSKVFEFYDSPLGLPVATVQSTNVIRLDNLAFSYYRVESEVKNHYKDIQSVSFSIPNDFINKYGEIKQLHAVWEECLTQPVLIANNANVITEFEKVLNKEVPSDFKYTFVYDTIHCNSGGTTDLLKVWAVTANYYFNSNISIIGKDISNFHEISSKVPYNNLIEKLYFVEYSENVFNPNAVCVTSEKMMQNLDNYLWADEVFAEIDETNFDLQNPKLFDIIMVENLNTHRVPTFWESLFKTGGNCLIKDDGKPIIYSSIETINGSYLTAKDNKEVFAERYKVYEDDVEDIKNISSEDSTTYILRYAVTDYIVNQAFIYEEGSDEPVCDAIVGQAEAIRNFDFIDMYFQKGDVITCFAVGMDKQNFISNFTGADVTPKPDRWAELLKFLEKCLAIAIIFTVISIAIKIFTLIKKTKVKVVIQERKRR